MGLSSNSLKNSREGAEASFSTAEAGGVRIVRSGPDAVAASMDAHAQRAAGAKAA